jgi:hypothetical protein
LPATALRNLSESAAGVKFSVLPSDAAFFPEVRTDTLRLHFLPAADAPKKSAAAGALRT